MCERAREPPDEEANPTPSQNSQVEVGRRGWGEPSGIQKQPGSTELFFGAVYLNRELSAVTGNRGLSQPPRRGFPGTTVPRARLESELHPYGGWRKEPRATRIFFKPLFLRSRFMRAHTSGRNTSLSGHLLCPICACLENVHR